jgi:hypothetical protein
MPFPIDLTRCLAFAPLDTPLEVCTIPSDALRARLAIEGLYERDRITCRALSSGNVLVRTAEGREILVDQPTAVTIEVAAMHEKPCALGDNRMLQAGPRRLSFVTVGAAF